MTLLTPRPLVPLISAKIFGRQVTHGWNRTQTVFVTHIWITGFGLPGEMIHATLDLSLGFSSPQVLHPEHDVVDRSASLTVERQASEIVLGIILGELNGDFLYLCR